MSDRPEDMAHARGRTSGSGDNRALRRDPTPLDLSTVDTSLEGMGASLKRTLGYEIARLERAAVNGLKGGEMLALQQLVQAYKALTATTADVEPTDPVQRRAWLEKKARG